MNPVSPVDVIATALITVLVAVLLGAALYVWYALALSRLFPKVGGQGWKGWVPILCDAEIMARGGQPAWSVVFFFVPILQFYGLYLRIVAMHRIGARFGHGAGMTVLGVLLPPVWASILGFGSGQASWSGQEGMRVAPSSPPAAYAPPTPALAPPTYAPQGYTAPAPAPAPVPQGYAAPVPQGYTASQTPGTPPPPPAQPATPLPPAFSAAAPPPAQPASVASPAPAAPSMPAAPPAAPPAVAPPAVAPPAVTEAARVQDPAASAWAPQAGFITPPPGVVPQRFASQSVDFAVPAASPPQATVTPSAVPTPEQAPAPAPPLASTPSAAVPSSAEDDLDETVVVSRAQASPWVVLLDTGQTLAIGAQTVLLGRNPSSDNPSVQALSVPDTTRTISKTHARLDLVDERWMITDLGSTNGVAVFAADGTERVLEPGSAVEVHDRVELGTVGLRLVRETESL